MKPHIVLATTALAFAALTTAYAEKDDSRPKLISPPPKINEAGDAVEELRKAATKDDAQASYELGERFLRGEGVARDPVQALQFLEHAAKAGSLEASFRLGKLYDEGEQVAKDPAKAFNYYRAAAQAGHAEAQHNLGGMYVSARGIKRDYVEGLAWVILATKNGVDPDSEKQIRTHLEQTKRTKFMIAAESRARELAQDFRGALSPDAVDRRSTLVPPKTQPRARIEVETGQPRRSTLPPPSVTPLPDLKETPLPPPRLPPSPAP